MSSVSSFVYVHTPGHRHTHTRTQAQTQTLPRWRGPFPSHFIASPLSCCAVRSGAGVGIGQEEQEEEDELSVFVFPPAGIDIFKLEKEEIVVLAKVCNRCLKERAEAEKYRLLQLEYMLSTGKVKALQQAGGLHMRGLETAERDIKKWNEYETGKVGKGRRDWWMTFAFPPAGIDIFKLEKEEIVALAKVFNQGLKERTEAEKYRRLQLEYMLNTFTTQIKTQRAGPDSLPSGGMRGN